MSKKILAALLAAATIGTVTVGLTACGQSPSEPTSSSSQSSTAEVVSTQETVTPESASVVSEAPAVSSETVTVASSETQSVEISSAETSSAAVSSKETSSTAPVKKLSKKDFMAKCSSYNYKELARNPKKYMGKYAQFYGRVLQVMEDGKAVYLRVSTKQSDYGNYYDDVVFVTYSRGTDESRILEDDMINIYGQMMDLYTYKTVQGSQLSIPWVHASYIDLDE